MSEEVRRLLSGLDEVRDVTGHCETIDRWIGGRDYERLGELAVALVMMETAASAHCWQPRSLVEHLRERLAASHGRANIALLLTHLVGEATPVRQLRETAARFASAQSLETIVATLEEYEGDRRISEFLFVLTHEAVLRQKLSEASPVADRLTERMRQEGHPLARLPLELTELEVEVPAYLPWYQGEGSSLILPGTSGGQEEFRTSPVTSPPKPPSFREVTTPEWAQAATKAVQDWQHESNGVSEARLFEFVEPIPARRVSPSLLRSLGLECLAGASDEAVRLTEITARQGYSHLFSAAATGGAYNSGEGGAYGRLSAWESVAALAGCPDDEIGRVSAEAGRCSWYLLPTESDWFFKIACDLGLVVLRSGGESLAVVAATDTD